MTETKTDVDSTAMQSILEQAAREGRSSLLEHEVYRFLAAAGCRVPRFELVPPGGALDAARLAALAGSGGQVVLKVVSPQIAHKTDVGGVAMVAAEPAAVAAGVRAMLEEVPRRYARALSAAPGHAPEPYRGLGGPALEAAIRADLRGILVVEKLALAGGGEAGAEVLLALRHNREFGPVLTAGVGGIDTELYGELCKKGLAVVSASAELLEPEQQLELFRGTLAYRRLTGRTRAGRRLLEDAAILRALAAFREVARRFGSDGPGEGLVVSELEVNPFGVVGGELCVLDGLLKFRPRQALPAPRPLASLDALLKPKSLAVIGVSAKGMNMGRIILRNILEAGFDRAHAYVVRPDCAEVDGVRCVPSVKDLPERVDVLVVAVGAEQVPELMEELAEHDRAVGVILIPGGMGEKEGGAGLEDRVRAAIGRARTAGRGLVANGGNCLGIVSRPGRYHTLFIPQEKLPLREDGRANVAFISQSGAYMISRMSNLDWLSPRYAVSTGNQVDLTVADFLSHLAGDPEVRTFAVYVEGFKDGDGLAFARAVQRVVQSGRDVIFYKAGRTAEGKTATSGHTASLAGDYDVCEAIVQRAGAHVARTFGEFQGLLKISSLMGGKRWRGRRLAALSNAGYETVGIADSLRGDGWSLELARLSEETRGKLAKALADSKLDALVGVRNPLDLTPMAGDGPHEEAVRAFLADPGVDVVLCATIPLTPAMATLAEGVPEEQSIRAAGSLVSRLQRLAPEAQKPIIACLDSGRPYDPMARGLEEAGIPCFRSADEAVRTIALYAGTRAR